MTSKVAKVLGYTNRLHVAPGQTLTAHLHAPGEVDVKLVELASSPERARHRASEIDGRYRPGTPGLRRGSCMSVQQDVPLPGNPGISLWVWPTRPARGEEQGLLTWGAGHGLFLSLDGRIEARWNGRKVMTLEPVLARRWSYVSLGFSDAGKPTLSVRTLEAGESISPETTGVEPLKQGADRGRFCLAGIDGGDRYLGCFDGKLAAPTIHDAGKLLARWELGDNPSSRSVQDSSGNGYTGTLINRPQKGMTGPNWQGDSVGWKDAPDQYNAIAFHRDDLSDAEWPVTFSFTVPEDLPSGAYGFEVSSEDGFDTLPFFVTARPGQPTAPVAFVVPLFSYLAYANERHWWPNPAVKQIAGAPLSDIIGPLERWAEVNELISLYDYHSDGTGNAHASLQRPLVNVRADYRHPLLRGPHQLSGDILTLEWLQSINQPFDIVTDYCLHERGVEVLEPYCCVITGSHPEYVSSQVLDAFEGYISKGGNLLHMGGNAFYFVVSLYDDEPHIMEVRRGVCGTIPWQSEPGESRQAATGELSGLWRWRGRSSHRLVGTGTSVVSFGKARPFVRTNAVEENPELSWIFEGVDNQEITADGLLFGGAAGFEMDAMRYDVGTPANTFKLAVADQFGSLSFQTLEDILGTGPTAKPVCDMVYRRLQSGGQIFSVPSVSWTSCLPDNGGNNDVATITQNVLRRFLNGSEDIHGSN